MAYILDIETNGGYGGHHFAYLPRRVNGVFEEEGHDACCPPTFNLYKSVVFPALSCPSRLSQRSAMLVQCFRILVHTKPSINILISFFAHIRLVNSFDICPPIWSAPPVCTGDCAGRLAVWRAGFLFGCESGASLIGIEVVGYLVNLVSVP